ncbi:LysR family transcriptional regulator [Marinobacter sp. SS8-8]|uniref:LysR family transcriptional regulator n=1 Tax=Marinobacter sp. SS8-8 TaxID=3050452 RepID=UPI0026DF85DB|nr:LysR family transcriptional regulator [Marinobacter sp. SS8-8]|tara:strand:- start:57761 stop:58663 length:903 start_codon:yes stop_codon:yes gene_type:complete
MEQLNLRHLYYFWVISREGSIARASEALELAPQTLSGQLATFEASVGGRLFSRERRQLILTDLGRFILGYADDIFALTGELTETLRLDPSGRPLPLRAGISASIHKLIGYYLLQPAMAVERSIQLECQTGRTGDLVLSLKRKELDLVLTDCMPKLQEDGTLTVHPLAGSSMSLFAAPALAGRLKDGFPESLNGQSLLANATDAPYFERLMNWFSLNGVRMKLVARIDDSALIKVFGSQGYGVFVAPTVIREEVCRQYEVEEIASINGVVDELFAITRGRKIAHEGVRAICEARPDFQSPK